MMVELAARETEHDTNPLLSPALDLAEDGDVGRRADAEKEMGARRYAIANTTAKDGTRDAERTPDHRDHHMTGLHSRRREAGAQRADDLERATERKRHESVGGVSGILHEELPRRISDLARKNEVALAARDLHLDVLPGRRVRARDVGAHIERDEEELAACVVPRRQDRGRHAEVPREEP